ncbi:MAG TPA: non-homologous end-joining DNA ligase [Saprospiraceae bacterium]|nr:non-homologous end-joining DNA ligase [Saprospiraceae bacterium]
MKKKEKTITLEGHEMRLSNLDKLMYPDDGITKGDVINYYQRIAEYMLPHTMNRPISMQRFPDGVGHKGFYQKDASDYFPAFITRVKVPLREKGKFNEQVCLNNAASLAYLANQGVLTSHPWLSRRDKLEYPDRMIFDLDPGKEKDFPHIVQIARSLRDICTEIGLFPYPMLTGSKGLHVTIPIIRNLKFAEIKEFARSIAQIMVLKFPDLLTLELRKGKRKGKIFVDILRNEYGQTAVAPYSLRSLKGAPIATPLTWNELDSKSYAQKYTIANIFRRLARNGDPWENIQMHAVSLKGARKKLAVMNEA